MFSQLKDAWTKRRILIISALLLCILLALGLTLVWPYVFARTPPVPLPDTLWGENIKDLPRWSEDSAWESGIPQAGASAYIPPNKSIVLDVSPPQLKSLIIEGTLICANRDISLRLDWMMIHGNGRLLCGAEGDPYQHHFEIVLLGGHLDEDVMGMGAGGLGMMGGRLELHGETRTSWVKLGETAQAGATEFLLEEAVDWQAGDHIVLSSTDYDPEQAEEVVVKEVHGNHVVIDRALKYTHFGEMQTFGEYELDERAEVGLLSRNIVIRGGEENAKKRIGGHALFKSGSVVQLEGVEIYNMGQEQYYRRYPLFWNFVGDGQDSYIKSSSIHHVFNRCITIQGTTSLLIQNNVTYDSIGHCFYMEDGSETDNTFEGNLGILTRAPDEGKALQESEYRPATFWITNPDNTFTNNVAAGSEGYGFWFALPEGVLGDSKFEPAYKELKPRETPVGVFDGNVAHSVHEIGLYVDQGPNPDGTSSAASSYQPSQQALFQNFTAYKARIQGVWLRGENLMLTGAKLADNGGGVTFAGDENFLEDSLVVGESENQGSTVSGEGPLVGLTFDRATIRVEHVTFVNFPAGALHFVGENQGAPDIDDFAEEVQFVDAEEFYLSTD